MDLGKFGQVWFGASANRLVPSVGGGCDQLIPFMVFLPLGRYPSPVDLMVVLPLSPPPSCGYSAAPVAFTVVAGIGCHQGQQHHGRIGGVGGVGVRGGEERVG